MFVTVVLSAFAVIPWSLAVAAVGATTGGGKAGSTAAMAAKGSGVRQDHGVAAVRGFGGSHRFGSTFDGQRFLIVDATPVEAQVFVDGRLLGSAADLLARALPLAPGRHTALIIAPGFKPYRAQFATDPILSTRLRVALSHE